MIARLMPLLLAIVAFLATLVVLNRHGEAPAPMAATTTGPIAHQPAYEKPAEKKSILATVVDSLAPTRAKTMNAPPTPAANVSVPAGDPSEAPPDPSELGVPALIQLEPPTDGSAQKATFTNMGGRRMTFTISTVDSTGTVHSSIELTTPPHKQQSLTEQGLLIMPGDQIVVKSPPYQDYTVSAY